MRYVSSIPSSAFSFFFWSFYLFFFLFLVDFLFCETEITTENLTLNFFDQSQIITRNISFLELASQLLDYLPDPSSRAAVLSG